MRPPTWGTALLLAAALSPPRVAAWKWGVSSASGLDPGDRYGHTIVGWQSSSTQGIVCGGYDGVSGALTSGCLLLDPGAGWRYRALVQPADAAPRAEHAAAYYGDYLLLHGGNTTTNAPATPEVFKIGAWTPVSSTFTGDVPPPRRGHASVTMAVPRADGTSAPTVGWVMFGGLSTNATDSSRPLGTPLGDLSVLDLMDGVTPAFKWLPVDPPTAGSPTPQPRAMHSMALRPPALALGASAVPHARPAQSSLRRRLSPRGRRAAAAGPPLGVASGTVLMYGGLGVGGVVLSDMWVLSLAHAPDAATLTPSWVLQPCTDAAPLYGHKATMVGQYWHVVMGGSSSADPAAASPAAPLRALNLLEWRWVVPRQTGSAPSSSRALLLPALWLVGTTDERDGAEDGVPGYEQSVLLLGGRATGGPLQHATAGSGAVGSAGGAGALPSTLFVLTEVGVEELSPEAELALLVCGGIAAAGCLLGFLYCAYRYRLRTVDSLASAGLTTELKRYYSGALPQQGADAAGPSDGGAGGGASWTPQLPRVSSGYAPVRSPQPLSSPAGASGGAAGAVLSPLTGARASSATGDLGGKPRKPRAADSAASGDASTDGGSASPKKSKSSSKKSAGGGSKRALKAGEDGAVLLSGGDPGGL